MIDINEKLTLNETIDRLRQEQWDEDNRRIQERLEKQARIDKFVKELLTRLSGLTINHVGTVFSDCHCHQLHTILFSMQGMKKSEILWFDITENTIKIFANVPTPKAISVTSLDYLKHMRDEADTIFNEPTTTDFVLSNIVRALAAYMLTKEN
jgi:hypothetical protein